MKETDLMRLVQTVDLAPVESIAKEVEDASISFAQKFTALGIDILRVLPQWAQSRKQEELDIRGSTLRYTLTPKQRTPSPSTDSWKEHVLPLNEYQAPETQIQFLLEILKEHTPQLPKWGLSREYRSTTGDPWVYCTMP